MSTQTDTYTGIASAGNWIVDQVKTVNCLPGRGMLATIESEALAIGGAPANVLADLAKMGTGLALSGFGVVGEDAAGRMIIDAMAALGVDVGGIAVSGEAPTSYTDVMNHRGTGERMFFHHRGANALFDVQHVPAGSLNCRIFHLGYLLLLDRMDAPDPEHGTRAAALLHTVRERGIKTSVDVVSEDSDRFKALVPPALPYVDYLILNEIEAARAVGRNARRADGSLDPHELKAAVEDLFALGDMELVAVHMAEGAYIVDRQGAAYSVGSLDLPQGFIQGAVGAGDAFCAGMLYGLHEGWTVPDATRLGSCCAAASLSRESATGGVGELDAVLALAERFPEQKPVVSV